MGMVLIKTAYKKLQIRTSQGKATILSISDLGYIFASCFVNTITAICKFGIPSTERMYLPISNLPLCR